MVLEEGFAWNDQTFGRHAVAELHQRTVAIDPMRLAAGQLKGQRPAFGLGAQVDFGRESATCRPSGIRKIDIQTVREWRGLSPYR